MMPFANNLDMSSGCLSGMCLLPPLALVWCPQSSSTPSTSCLFPFFPHNTLHEQHWRAAWLPLVGVLVASPPPGGAYDSSDPHCRLSLLQACLALFLVAVLCISF